LALVVDTSVRYVEYPTTIAEFPHRRVSVSIIAKRDKKSKRKHEKRTCTFNPTRKFIKQNQPRVLKPVHPMV
jgi:hypothetical protein